MAARHVEGITIYAVDFDGTLCTHRFPGIGEPNEKLIKRLIKKREAGNKVILWTNRMGERLEEAVEWCNERGLFFDAVNDNIPEVLERYKDVLKGQKSSPKITADIFIDDAACSYGLPFGNEGCPIGDCWEESCRWCSQRAGTENRADELANKLIKIRAEYGDDLFRQVLGELGYD